MTVVTRTTRSAVCSLLTAGTVTLSAPALASMGNVGNTYGVFPLDVASAQALSMFNNKVSTTYYNPAYLATDERGELTAGAMHAEQELRAVGSDRDGEILSESPSQHLMIGMKTNLGDLMRHGPDVHLGFIAGVDKFANDLLAFNSKTSNQGQFLSYDRQPLFMILGGGTTIWRGIDAGFATRTTLDSSATLSTRTDLAGNTQYEQLNVEAEPSVRSIASINVNYGETICPDDACWADGFETAFTYRVSSSSRTTVEANTVIPGLIPSSDPLNFTITTYDSYQPPAYGFGIHYDGFRHTRVALSLEQQQWSDLEDTFRNKDTIKDQAGANFDDIIVPRLGVEHRFSESFSFISGLAYQKSPLQDGPTTNVNYFDNDRYIAGLGLSWHWGRNPIFNYPVRFDIGYQYQLLKERDFTISTTDPSASNDGARVTTDGEIHVVSGAMTLKF